MTYSPFTATGDGTTTAYTIAFDYIDTTDVKARVNNVVTTAFTVSGSTVTFTTAPPNGQSIKIYRDTDNATIQADFQSGSALRAVDLNSNFTQLLYVTQESTDLADTATSDSANAVTTANTASTNASAAVTTANTASATANAASSAVATAGFYTPIAALANLPASPSNEDRVEVVNSTGVESNSNVSGVPVGFVGDSDLTVRLQYNSSTSKWEWQQYFAADPDARYITADSAALTGTPTAPTASQGTNTTQIATTAFVNAEIAADTASLAPTASPTFTGTPAAPTATQGTNTTQIATTAFVNAEIAADTASLAPLASPALTGVPTAPTAAQGTNTTQVATTAFVNSEISSDLTAAIGSTVQAYDADTTKNDVANTFTAAQTLNAGLTLDGSYKQAAEAVSALDIDLSTGNYFTKTISANSTFTFSNPPSSGTVGSFTLELTHTSGTVTWPTSVKFNADTAPTLTTGKTHLFFFVTDDGGTRYRGAALVDYVN